MAHLLATKSSSFPRCVGTGFVTAGNYLLAGLSLAGTIFGCYWLCPPVRYRARDSPVVDYWLPGVSCFLAVPGACWLLVKGGATLHLRLAALYSMLNWLTRVITWINALYYLPSNPRVQRDPFDRSIIRASGVLSMLLLTVATVALMTQRLFAIQAGSMMSLGLWRLKPLMLTMAVIATATVVAFLTQEELQAHSMVLVGVLVILATLGMSVLLVAMYRSLSVARAGAADAPAILSERTQNTVVTLRFELLTALAALLSTLAVVVLQCLMGVLDDPPKFLEVLDRIFAMVDTLSNQSLALVQSGALTGAASGTRERRKIDRERQQRHQRATVKWHAGNKVKSDVEKEWDDQVQELAGRGLTLSALLKFYRELPTRMPQYEPNLHTTDLVVRWAIIPMSASNRCHGSAVLMDNAYVRPHKMVTHNWANLFVDLVASICADALGEPEFFLVSQLLKQDLECLERWVERAGVGERAYWVCAFAVNQHAGICETPLSPPDPVSGAACPKCYCGLPKAWNDTPPLLPDGRSVVCQMNKFEDMMKYLTVTDPQFEQVVAISRDFSTFSRAWCVAELATANEMGMLQRIKISSWADLQEKAEGLRKLRIQDMQASRKEDAELILAGIEDHDAFNEALQKLLFEDLFPAWKSLDAEEKMGNIGRTIRWFQTPVWTKEAAAFSL